MQREVRGVGISCSGWGLAVRSGVTWARPGKPRCLANPACGLHSPAARLGLHSLGLPASFASCFRSTWPWRFPVFVLLWGSLCERPADLTTFQLSFPTGASYVISASWIKPGWWLLLALSDGGGWKLRPPPHFFKSKHIIEKGGVLQSFPFALFFLQRLNDFQWLPYMSSSGFVFPAQEDSSLHHSEGCVFIQLTRLGCFRCSLWNLWF